MNKAQREATLDLIEKANAEIRTWVGVSNSEQRRDPAVCEAAHANAWLWRSVKDHCRQLIIDNNEED